MKELGIDRANGLSQPNLWNRIPFRATLVYLGSFFLLVGNTLPWPCTETNSHECDPALIVNDIGVEYIAILVAIGILLITLAVNHLKSPLNNVSWLSVWVFAYLLMVAKLKSVWFIDKVAYYSPLVDVNLDLGEPSFILMPASLIAFWLVIRPEALRRRWALPVVISLVVLNILTGVFLILALLRIYLFALSISPYAEPAIFGMGPVLILAGGLVLLGVEYVAVRRDRKRVMTQEEAAGARTAPTTPKKAYQIGFWSASLAAAIPIFRIVVFSIMAEAGRLHSIYEDVAILLMRTARGGLIPSIYENVSYLLSDIFGSTGMGVSFLLALVFIVLMASIGNYAPPEKRVWSRIGVFFAIAYALLLGLGHLYYTQLIFSFSSSSGNPVLPTLYRVVSVGPSVLMGLAGLCALPALRRDGIELAIRWCLAINAVLIAADAIGLALGGRPILVLELAGAVAQLIVFPAAAALLAVVFRRAENLINITSREEAAP